MDPCRRKLVLLQPHHNPLSSSSSKTLAYESKRKSTAQTWSGLFAVMDTGGHKVDIQHAVPRNMQFRGSCTTCQESGDEPKQDRDGWCATAVAAACKLVGRNAVWTLTQAGGDTTTWSVCTCWPEAVTTGASVCSCTAVTVPCACGQGRTIQYILRQVNIRQSSSGVPWKEAYPHFGTWNLWTSQ